MEPIIDKVCKQNNRKMAKGVLSIIVALLTSIGIFVLAWVVQYGS